MGQFLFPRHEYVRFRLTLLLKKLLQPARKRRARVNFACPIFQRIHPPLFPSFYAPQISRDRFDSVSTASSTWLSPSSADYNRISRARSPDMKTSIVSLSLPLVDSERNHLFHGRSRQFARHNSNDRGR